MNYTVLLVLSLIMAACSHYRHVEVYSDPPGATIYEGAQNLGRTPVTIPYPTDQLINGCIRTMPLIARWPSQSHRTDILTLCQEDQTFTFHHPGGEALPFDVQAGLVWEQIRAQQALAAGVERNARMQGYGVIQQMLPKQTILPDGRRVTTW